MKRKREKTKKHKIINYICKCRKAKCSYLKKERKKDHNGNKRAHTHKVFVCEKESILM